MTAALNKLFLRLNFLSPGPSILHTHCRTALQCSLHATKKKISLRLVWLQIHNIRTRLCLSWPKIRYFLDKDKRELQGACEDNIGKSTDDGGPRVQCIIKEVLSGMYQEHNLQGVQTRGPANAVVILSWVLTWFQRVITIFVESYPACESYPFGDLVACPRLVDESLACLLGLKLHAGPQWCIY